LDTVIPGLHRSDAAYLWPAYIVRPDQVRLVYLDLNHWISLAKAATGHRDGERHREALEVLRQAKASGRCIFPLSSTHYMEMSTIKNPRQRADVGGIMEELSEFATLLNQSVVMRLEVEEVLEALGQPRPERYVPLPLVGYGVGHALGMRGGLRIRSAEGDVTERVRDEWPGGPEQFDSRLSAAELLLERATLCGPSDEDVPALKQDGWNPRAAREVAEKRAAQEREQAALLDASPSWRRGRLRDLVSARYLLIELNAVVSEALAVRGLKIEEVFGDTPSARRMMDSMPSADVSVSLMTAAHRNPQTKWTPNDIFDIDGLSLAAAYCDVVVTDRHARNSLIAAGVPARAGTEVPATLAELSEIV
jgi:hypothetical protein